MFKFRSCFYLFLQPLRFLVFDNLLQKKEEERKAPEVRTYVFLLRYKDGKCLKCHKLHCQFCASKYFKHSIYIIYINRKVLAPVSVVYFAKPVWTSLCVVWIEQHAQYTCFLPQNSQERCDLPVYSPVDLLLP